MMKTTVAGREGVLSSTTFPGLIYAVLRDKGTGVLTLTGDVTEKSVYIHSGRPVFATSNERDDRLGQVFFKAGLISLENLLIGLDRSFDVRKRLGTVLVEMGFIKPKDLVEGVLAQVRNIICSLFLWTRGRYRYAPGPLPSEEVITLHLSAGNVILEGIRRIEGWDRIWEAVGHLDAIYQTNAGTEDLGRDLNLSLEEWTLLSHCERPIALRDLLRASRIRDFEVCRLLWALLTIGIVSKTSPRA
jgi:hypothetical protein